LRKRNIIPELGSIKKVLILQTAFIGDVILATPLIRMVSRLLPDAEIHFVTIPASQNVMETSPHITKLWIFDKRGKNGGVRGLLAFSRLLRNEKFQLAIVPHRSIRSALLVRLTGIVYRIGFDRSAGSFFFNLPVEYDFHRHEIDRNLNLLRPLGYSESGFEPPDMVANEEDKRKIRDWMTENNIGDSENYVAVAPGSVWPTKRWPASYWGKLIDMFQQSGLKTVIIGAGQDRFLLPEIHDEIRIKAPEALGRFTLRQSAELIRRSRLLISNDSAPTHLGVAVRRPVLTIFGSTVPDFGFYPPGPHDRIAQYEGLYCRPCTNHGKFKCPLKHFKCMNDLLPEKIFKIAMEMLDESGQNQPRKS